LDVNTVFSLVLAYLLGSLPFAYFISLKNGVDIRKVGDYNVGAFNVFRHVGFEAGLATLVLDMSKGAAAIILARVLHADEWVVFLSGILAVIGHNWPVFLKFKGGRGEATVIGILFMVIPWIMTFTFLTGIIVLFSTRNSILVGAVLFIPIPFIGLISYYLFQTPPLVTTCYSVLLPCISGFTHWLTTYKLPPDAKKESGIFRIASTKNRHD
jgi:glycerol-3-phosphate acyltransferase PlsY